MDRYQRVMTMGKFGVLKGNDYLVNDEIRKNSSMILEISFDQFLTCLKRNVLPRDKKIHFIIYDEDIIETREKCMVRFQFLKYLNSFSSASFDFRLSDSALPAYLSFMNSIGWKREDETFYHMSLDRNPTSYKNIQLETAKGKVELPEEKLLWFSDKTLRLLPLKCSSLVLQDTMKMKKFLPKFMEEVGRRYRIQDFNDFEKAYLVYHYLFDPSYKNDLAIPTKGIRYANGRAYQDAGGVQRLRPSISRWESRPVGTMEHKKGVCTGQSRLFSTLLCNPYMKVYAEAVYGYVPSGERHCWSDMVIGGRLYQCCTTMKGLFANLDAYGYKSDADEKLPLLYPHASLNYCEVEKIHNSVKRLQK